MQVRYKNQFYDIVYLNITMQLSSVVYQLSNLIFSVVIVWTLFSNLSPPSSFKQWLLVIITLLVIDVVLWLIQILLTVLYLYSRKDKAVLTEHTVELQDEAIYEETQYNRSYFYWHTIEKMVQTRRYIVISLSKYLFLVIPNKAFVSNDERKAFVAEIKRRMTTNRTKR